jgi:hypothetical protein
MEDLPTREEIEAHRKKINFVAPEYEDFEKHLNENEKDEPLTKKEEQKLTDVQQQFFKKYLAKEKGVDDLLLKTSHDMARESFENFTNPMARNSEKLLPTPSTSMDRGTFQRLEDAVKDRNPSLVMHCFKKMTEELVPSERLAMIHMKDHKEKIKNPEVLFLVEYFTKEDLQKLVSGQCLSKKRLAEIQETVNK